MIVKSIEFEDRWSLEKKTKLRSYCTHPDCDRERASAPTGDRPGLGIREVLFFVVGVSDHGWGFERYISISLMTCSVSMRSSTCVVTVIKIICSSQL